MKVLIVHGEAKYFAGAERVLAYFLEGLIETELDVTVAAVPGARMWAVIPPEVKRIELPDNQKFTLQTFLAQVSVIEAAQQREPFDVVHGWAARDWELTVSASKLLNLPAVGTLHDHPDAPFISPSRQKLMRLAANHGLSRLVCVSEAVRKACLDHGYHPAKLEVVYNGLPPWPPPPAKSREGPLKLGFLGAFSERKGLHGLFQMLNELSRNAVPSWEMHIAGGAQDQAGQALEQSIRAEFSPEPWWNQVRWLGWIKDPREFLAGLDLLIAPSSDFDPFPTVVLESGLAGTPVFGSRIGGIPEMIQEGETGWMFSPGDWRTAGQRLAEVIQDSERLRRAGAPARERVLSVFSLGKMVEKYRGTYTTMTSNV